MGCGVLGAIGARPVEVEGAGVLGSPLRATVATGALGTGSFRGLPTPGKRRERQEGGELAGMGRCREATSGLTEWASIPSEVQLPLAPSLPPGSQQ